MGSLCAMRNCDVCLDGQLDKNLVCSNPACPESGDDFIFDEEDEDVLQINHG